MIVKWGLAGLLILPQALLLGATFPLMSTGLIRRVSRDGRSDTGRLISILYFANSIGAAVGVLVAGFYLIGVAGLPGTLLTAAVINMLVGLTVFGAVRLVRDNYPELEHTEPQETMETTPPSPELPMLWRVLLIVAAGTALASFVYEIAWVRMLALVLGSATHSFELMLSAFILGLALGAFWVRTRADAFRDPVRALGVTQWAMGALAILTLSAYLMSFDWMAFLIQGLDQNAAGIRPLHLREIRHRARRDAARDILCRHHFAADHAHAIERGQRRTRGRRGLQREHARLDRRRGPRRARADAAARTEVPADHRRRDRHGARRMAACSSPAARRPTHGGSPSDSPRATALVAIMADAQREFRPRRPDERRVPLRPRAGDRRAQCRIL